MSFEKILFLAFTSLIGFAIGFLATYLGVKISKVLILVGIVAALFFFFFLNGTIEYGWLNIQSIFSQTINSVGGEINSLKHQLFRNIPLAIGVIVGAIYGFKKAI